MSDSAERHGEPRAQVGPEFDVVNEFAAVTVRRIETRNGARVEITSQRLGYRIELDAMALESLTWQTMDVFSKFLETPLGPPDEH